ncbi:hypothetical protein GA0115253_104903 [Streptomyces sp. Termitarium-T10T-6]|nr:hypothetical protein GA0115253_104903 [Streptomyces sp. Termitarium-T10T-6]
MPYAESHPGERGDEDGVDAQRVGDRADVLAARAAETGQRVAGDVVASLHGDLLDGVGHVEHGDLQEAGRRLRLVRPASGGAPHLVGELGEPLAYVVGVERKVAVRAEDRREVGGLDAAEHHVGVGDGEGTAPAVAGGAGVGAGRVGADAVAAAVEVQNGAAAGRDGVDAHHRGTHPDPGDLRPQFAFELPGVVRHIGGGTAHVEADDLAVAGLLGGADHADDASGRSGEDGVLAPEAGGFAQSPVGLEEHQPDPVEAGGDLVDVPAEDG